MKRTHLLASILGILVTTQGYAETAQLAQGDLTTQKGEFNNGSALSFKTNFGKSLVVQCNNAYGLIGLSDQNYVAYNRIIPATRVSSEACYNAIDEIKSGKSLSFFWKKTADCSYFGCKYVTAYSVK